MANVFVTGSTGTGKSYFIRDTLKKLNLPLIVVSLKKQDIYNVNDEVVELGKKAVSTENYNTIVDSLKDSFGKFNMGFYMDFIDTDEEIAFMDKLANALRHKKNIILYVDEAHTFIPESGKYSKNLVKLISIARENNLHIILASQRPQDIKKSTLNNCKFKISFLLSETNAIKAMSKIFEDVSEEEIKNLKMHHFILQDAYSKETLKGVKI